jgi:hypothetical protein
MNARERVVLYEVCSFIVRMDWRIKFVCMVDQNGKLLVGRSRSIIPFTSMTDKPAGVAGIPTHITNLKIDDLVEVFLRCKNMYLFYSDYLLWVIGKCIGHMKEYENEFNCYVDGSVVDEASPYFEISGMLNWLFRLLILAWKLSFVSILSLLTISEILLMAQRKSSRVCSTELITVYFS